MKAFNNLGFIRNPFNPYKYTENVDFKRGKLAFHYTRRAKQQMEKVQLIVEMQIYFSCVIQKRVLFHESCELESFPVNDKLAISLRAVQSDRYDPVFFANNHPVKKEYSSKAASKMTAKELFLDYKDGEWLGSFNNN